MNHSKFWMAAVGAVALAAAAAAGWWTLSGGHADHDDGVEVDVDEGREIAYWVAPMDPSYRRDEPGKSPMGMALEPVYADEVGEPGEVTVSAAVRNALGIRVGEARRESLPRVIHAPGRVAYDESRRSRVDLRVPGWIEVLHVRTRGSAVAAGDPLFDLYSPQLVSAQEEFLQAMRTGNASRIESGRERLAALGVSAGQIDAIEADRAVRQHVTIHARQGGVVESLEVAEGMQLAPGRPAMTITDPSEVWVIADVFASQSQWVESGQPAAVRFRDRNGGAHEGEIDFVYPDLDTETRTLPVRISLGNADGELRPGQLASVRIDAPGTDAVVTVPEQAVIRTGRQDRIAIAHGDGRFEIRPVVIGIAADGRSEIREGVEAGEAVVVAGQFLLDSEANVDAESERMAEAEQIEAEPGDERHQASGTLQALDAEARRLTIDHEPVEALDWPRMTMDFQAADDLDLAALEVDQEVEFTFRETADGQWQVTAIEVAR